MFVHQHYFKQIFHLSHQSHDGGPTLNTNKAEGISARGSVWPLPPCAYCSRYRNVVLCKVAVQENTVQKTPTLN